MKKLKPKKQRWYCKCSWCVSKYVRNKRIWDKKIAVKTKDELKDVCTCIDTDDCETCRNI